MIDNQKRMNERLSSRNYKEQMESVSKQSSFQEHATNNCSLKVLPMSALLALTKFLENRYFAVTPTTHSFNDLAMIFLLVERKNNG
jgi:hypothetical protein